MKAKWYKSKPVQVKALRWTKDVTRTDMYEFTDSLTQLDDVLEEFKVYDKLHGVWIPFQYGDWIIQGTQGEYYPCADSVFKVKYDEA